MNAQNLLKGWTSAKLSSLIETFERGISYTSEDIQDMHGLPLVNLACIDKSGFYRDGELKSFSGSYTKSDLIYPLDMLIACTDLTRNADIIGTPILVPTDYEEYVYTMDLAKLKPKPCIDNRFLYYALKTSTYRNYIKPWASGTNVLHLNLQGVYDYVLQFPIDIKEQRRIANLLSSLDNKIALNRAINQNLRARREQRESLLSLCRAEAVNGDVSRNLEATPDRSSEAAGVRRAA